MKILKPSWVHHDGHPIFSIDIHPDDTRFVTGGQGSDSVGRLVIWNMVPVLNFYKNQNCDSDIPKLFCQLDHHNACVNSVRWCHSGRFLASGGDDKIIFIWRLTAKANPNTVSRNNCSFGKTAYETWKPVFTLRSHTGDILDLSWSPDDKYLASASVDNTVLIWDALKFPVVIAELKGHTSLVKGVTWDPVGKYIASQSDDKSLKIWRTVDWAEEHSIEDPFRECGGTTHVLRLDWSPDGMYLVSAHASNGGGPTSIILERDGWTSDKDFVGHRKAVVCVRFNPNIIKSKLIRNSLVALGSRDRSVSVWSTHLKRPVVVVKDLFTNSVMDMAWSSCGMNMFACSWDGTVAVAQFSTDEVGIPLSSDEKISLHHKYYGHSMNSISKKIVQNVHVFLAQKTTEDSTAKKPLADFDLVLETNETPNIVRGPIDKQIETRTPDGKRRITPKFLPDSSLLPCTTTAIFQNSEQNGQSNLRENMVSGIEEMKLSSTDEREVSNVITPVVPQSDEDEPIEDVNPIVNGEAPVHETQSPATVQLKENQNGESSLKASEASAAISSIEPNTNSKNGELEAIKSLDLPTSASATLKRKLSEDTKLPKPPKKILKVETIQEKAFVPSPRPMPMVIASPATPAAVALVPAPPKPHSMTSPPRRRLNPLKIAGVLTITVNKKPDTKYTLEVENSSNRNYILRCQHVAASETLPGLYWNIQTEAPICGVTGDAFRVVAACEDATVHVLDLKGRYAFPPLVVSSVPSKMAHNCAYLLIVTTKATMHVWNIHTKKNVKTESIMPLINQPSGNEMVSTKLVDIAHVSITSTGIPRVILTTGKSFIFNRDMGTWMVMSDPNASGLTSDVSALQFDPLCKRTGIISQIKLRLATATELERTDDVREWLIVLAKTLAANGLRAELHQLCEDLMGPTHSAAIAKAGNWSATIVGVDKRAVLRVVLNSLLHDLAWQDFYTEFKDMLKQVEDVVIPCQN